MSPVSATGVFCRVGILKVRGGLWVAFQEDGKDPPPVGTCGLDGRGVHPEVRGQEAWVPELWNGPRWGNSSLGGGREVFPQQGRALPLAVGGGKNGVGKQGI